LESMPSRVRPPSPFLLLILAEIIYKDYRGHEGRSCLKFSSHSSAVKIISPSLIVTAFALKLSQATCIKTLSALAPFYYPLLGII
jgi:hypothetical protein